MNILEVFRVFSYLLNPRWLSICLFILVFLERVQCDEYESYTSYSSIISLTYKDAATGEMTTKTAEIGRYGTSSRRETEWGIVVHVRSADNRTDGCRVPVNVPSERWVALIQRGVCKFQKKIENAAIVKNASAVVIYNHKDEDELLSMDHRVDDVVAVFISQEDGKRIVRLVDNGTRVLMNITLGSQSTNTQSNISKTSVLFVSISFIVLMIISLAWLVFYYIQRFRYAHAKERLSKRLMNAAKKAISKMPLRTLKNGDKETELDFDQCAICIEGYKASEVMRILPCNHMFHKSCVDPWLIEQRSCPVCKLDILNAYGLQLHSSRESVVNIEIEGLSTSAAPSDVLSGDNTREIECEIVRYQQAQIEYHPACTSNDSSATTLKQHEDEASPSANRIQVMPCSVSMSTSMESVHSTESESGELQSLMPRNKEDKKSKDEEPSS